MIEALEHRTSDLQGPEQNSEQDHDAAGSGTFTDLLQALEPAPGLQDLGGERARRIAEANRQALVDQRITDDDLRVIENTRRGRTNSPGSAYHCMRQGATAATRGQLGLGRLACVFKPSLAQAADPADPQLVSAQRSVPQPAAAPGAASEAGSPGAGSVVKPAAAGSEVAQNTPGPGIGQASSDAQARGVGMLNTQFSASSFAAPQGAALRLATEQQRVARSAQPALSIGRGALNRAATAERGAQSGPATVPTRGAKDTGQRSAAEALTRAARQPAGPSRRGIIQDVLRLVRANLGPRRSTVKLQLAPPELGMLRVNMKLDGDRLQLDIEAQTLQVRQLLEKGSGSLREALTAQGISLERFSVTLEESQAPPAQSQWDAEVGDGGAQPHGGSSGGHEEQGTDEDDQSAASTEQQTAEQKAARSSAGGRLDIHV